MIKPTPYVQLELNFKGTVTQGWRSVFVIGGAKFFFLKFLSQHWGGEIILNFNFGSQNPLFPSRRQCHLNCDLRLCVRCIIGRARFLGLHYWGGEIFQFQSISAAFLNYWGGKRIPSPPLHLHSGGDRPLRPPESQSLTCITFQGGGVQFKSHPNLHNKIKNMLFQRGGGGGGAGLNPKSPPS